MTRLVVTSTVSCTIVLLTLLAVLSQDVDIMVHAFTPSSIGTKPLVVSFSNSKLHMVRCKKGKKNEVFKFLSYLSNIVSYLS
jgi:hypothetical protein